MDKIIQIIAAENKFNAAIHIEEIDLGPFKHKVDIGRDLRVAAYSLLHTCLEKIHEKVPSSTAIEVVLDGLRDPDSDCQSLSLQILLRIMQVAPGIVLGQIQNIIEGTTKIVETEKKKSKQNVTNLMRIVVKTLLQMKNLPDIENSSQYQEYYMKLINDQELTAVISEVSN